MLQSSTRAIFMEGVGRLLEKRDLAKSGRKLPGTCRFSCDESESMLIRSFLWVRAGGFSPPTDSTTPTKVCRRLNLRQACVPQQEEKQEKSICTNRNAPLNIEMDMTACQGYDFLSLIFTGIPYFGRIVIVILPSSDWFGDSLTSYFCTIIARSSWPSMSAKLLPMHMCGPLRKGM